MDRFVPDFPADLLYLVEHQVWARVDAPDCVTMGITALGLRLAGEIYTCRPKAVGTVVEQGRACGVVELAKSIVSVRTPLSGTIIETNPQVIAEPQRVNQDPYGSGWLLRLRPSALAQERAALAEGEAVAPAMAEHARLYRMEFERE